jgi:hypothetical protein
VGQPEQGLNNLDMGRARDLQGRAGHPWARRAVLALLAAFVALGLAGVVGQRARTTNAASSSARVRLVAPATLRGGLLWPARIEVRALRNVQFPRLVLGPGWLRGMQVNTIEPAASSESSRAGRLVLSYDALNAGDTLTVYLQAQVNPTTVGRQDTSVALDDQATELARIAHTTTVLP